MRYGNCISYKDTQSIKILKHTGFDYVETGLSSLYSASQNEIEDFVSALKENNIKCEAVNVLFPGGIALTGENPEFAKAGDYVSEVFEKTKSVGFKRVVFGSGGARKYPDGFSKEKAIEQVIKVISDYLLPAAEKYDFVLSIEELNKGETNIINTLEEAEYIAVQVNNPRIKILADLYHIGLENTDLSVLAELTKKNLIAHCHIANPYNKRCYPFFSDSAESLKLYKEFFGSLKSGGYDERISLEGGLGGYTGDVNNIVIPDWVSKNNMTLYLESKKSLEFMKSLE